MSRKKVAAVAHTIGIDTGKNMLHVIGLDERGAVVLREKVSRSRIAARLVNVPRCLIGIEAVGETKSAPRTLQKKPSGILTMPPGPGLLSIRS